MKNVKLADFSMKIGRLYPIKSQIGRFQHENADLYCKKSQIGTFEPEK